MHFQTVVFWGRMDAENNLDCWQHRCMHQPTGVKSLNYILLMKRHTAKKMAAQEGAPGWKLLVFLGWMDGENNFGSGQDRWMRQFTKAMSLNYILLMKRHTAKKMAAQESAASADACLHAMDGCWSSIWYHKLYNEIFVILIQLNKYKKVRYFGRRYSNNIQLQCNTFLEGKKYFDTKALAGFLPPSSLEMRLKLTEGRRNRFIVELEVNWRRPFKEAQHGWELQQ